MFKDCINLTQIMRQNFIEPDSSKHSKDEFEKHSNQKDYVKMLSDMREVN